jgi:hypothetical protein
MTDSDFQGYLVSFIPLLILCTSCGLFLMKFISRHHSSKQDKREVALPVLLPFDIRSFSFSFSYQQYGRRKKNEGIRVNFKFCHSVTSACDYLTHRNRNEDDAIHIERTNWLV